MDIASMLTFENEMKGVGWIPYPRLPTAIRLPAARFVSALRFIWMAPTPQLRFSRQLDEVSIPYLKGCTHLNLLKLLNSRTTRGSSLEGNSLRDDRVRVLQVQIALEEVILERWCVDGEEASIGLLSVVEPSMYPSCIACFAILHVL
ncbi:hypothetical protein F511_37089 [Dorcoceras hygrometricum]|uniref:Uncharacterized protein n=1 Tax=Dorcoceras hygrometricum TaxID=472368 RepID=A0A2Z7CFR2_9LAMI|nr:hypothetical protein F511_37089 [Dorcoceras hygrometricum]